MSPPAPSHWAFSPIFTDRGRFAIIVASFGAVCVYVVHFGETRDPLANRCKVRRGRNGYLI